MVDGQNLYYTLKGMSLIEKDVKWSDLFKSMLDTEDELARAYWFRPQKILDTHYTPQNIRYSIVAKKFSTYAVAYKNNPQSIPAAIQEQVSREAEEAERWLKDEKTKFSNIEYCYDEIPLEHGDIEVVKNGILKVNPYTKTILGEKGVDIALAVKMIALSVERKCDKIILVSGDYDYAEAIKYVKNNMTKIHIVKIHKGVPPRNRSVSRDLAVLADRIIDVYESDLKANFLRGNR